MRFTFKDWSLHVSLEEVYIYQNLRYEQDETQGLFDI